MIKKINTFNEVAELIGNRKAELKVKIGFSSSVLVEDVKSFKKYIKSEYIDCIADAILSCDTFNFDTATEISVINVFGDTLTETVEFFIEQ